MQKKKQPNPSKSKLSPEWLRAIHAGKKFTAYLFGASPMIQNGNIFLWQGGGTGRR
jgi:hypothetical protein